MPLKVGLVLGSPGVEAWVLDLPGCVAGAATTAGLEAILPLVIREYAAWASGHGDRLDVSSAWEVVESVDLRDHAASGGEFCFQADYGPVSEAELAQALSLLRWVREDLTAVLASVPDEILDWQPGPETVAHFDAWAPRARSIREIMQHVLQLQVYCRDSLQDGPAQGIFADVADPATELERSLTALAGTDAAARGRTYLPRHPGRDLPEQWTMRKALRRMIAHERVHTAEIVHRRTWLLLGPPGSGRSDT
jgi:hypothetical protein